MTPINCIFFPEKNPYLPIVETDRCTILPPPPLTLINNKQSIYFNKNKLLLSGNTAGKREINIAIQYDIKQGMPSDPMQHPKVLTSLNIRGGGGKTLFTRFLTESTRLISFSYSTYFKHVHSPLINKILHFLSFAGHREGRKCKLVLKYRTLIHLNIPIQSVDIILPKKDHNLKGTIKNTQPIEP